MNEKKSDVIDDYFNEVDKAVTVEKTETSRRRLFVLGALAWIHNVVCALVIIFLGALTSSGVAAYSNIVDIYNGVTNQARGTRENLEKISSIVDLDVVNQIFALYDSREKVLIFLVVIPVVAIVVCAVWLVVGNLLIKSKRENLSG